MRGDNNPPVEKARYFKFSWDGAKFVPAIGQLGYVPQEPGAFRMFREGVFQGDKRYGFPARKIKELLSPVGCCIFCNRAHESDGKELVLTSEHVVPEFLGAGLELPKASCDRCQKITSLFESTIAQEMFDPVRKSFCLVGKNGELNKINFPLDVGRETVDRHMIPLAHYPTILVMPSLYPASACSERPFNTDGLFNFRIYNINADPRILDKYDIEGFSTQMIDGVRFCQMVAKIAHVYTTCIVGHGGFRPLLTDFITENVPPKTGYASHFNFVGSLWQSKCADTTDLHELQFGSIAWNGISYLAVRVRLFASYGMPAYHVVVGNM